MSEEVESYSYRVYPALRIARSAVLVLCRRHLGVRRLDAALELWGRGGAAQDSLPSAWCEGGVKAPHSKALRAFSRFPGPRQPTGMGDRLQRAATNRQEDGKPSPHRVGPSTTRRRWQAIALEGNVLRVCWRLQFYNRARIG
jgi:hypothetical protein